MATRALAFVTLAREVFAALADGREHSGESLAEASGVTRSAIWKAIEQLRELGLDIEARTNRGYRLTAPAAPLDLQSLRAAISSAGRTKLDALEILWETDSTNAQLLSRSPPPAGRFAVLLAENQTAGRGRRGRPWQVALGGSVCLSIATSFESLPRDLPALTLVVGVCVWRAVTAGGASGLGLKWPNDLVVADGLAKVGGILAELRAEAGGPGHVVVGIGLNLRLPAAARERIAELGTTASDLVSCGLSVERRESLAAAVIDECLTGLEQFGKEGFAPFVESWRSVDVLRDRKIEVSEAGGSRLGVARGIDRQGALQIEDAAGRKTALQSGEVSVRPRVAHG